MKRRNKRTLAIPNGSLQKSTLALLALIGIRIKIRGRHFIAEVEGTTLFNQVIIMRPQDMPEALIDGLVDVAICGYDCLIESGLDNQLTVITELNYSKKTQAPVRVVLFGKTGKFVDDENIIITSEYPNLTSKFFKKAKIRFSHGGTEQKVAYGKYDYGVCITETGGSLRENGLVIIKELLISPTVLIARKETPELKYFGELLAGGLRANKYRLIKMNVDKRYLSDVLHLMPAAESPTINKLSNGNYAIETVVEKEKVGNLIIKLRQIGVNSILVQEIDLMCY